jgi:hypothetical protein
MILGAQAELSAGGFVFVIENFRAAESSLGEELGETLWPRHFAVVFILDKA